MGSKEFVIISLAEEGASLICFWCICLFYCMRHFPYFFLASPLFQVLASASDYDIHFTFRLTVFISKHTLPSEIRTCKITIFGDRFDVMTSCFLRFRLLIQRHCYFLSYFHFDLKTKLETFPHQVELNLSHATIKCVFGSFRPGKTQTDLLSYIS